MKSKRLMAVSAAAVVFLSLSGTAQAGGGGGGGVCSDATLKGAFAVSAHGTLLGLLDSNNTLHPFATPSTLDDVALITFDGRGMFTRIDYGNVNGAPKGGPDFTGNQRGAYSVKSNCTGTMTVVYDNGTILNLQMVVADDGTVIKAIIATEIVTTAGPTTPPLPQPCSPDCHVGVQVSFDGKKVFTHGDHDR